MKRTIAKLTAGIMLASAAISSNAAIIFAEEDTSLVGSAEAEATVLEHWTFTELFIPVYVNAADSWNAEHPDRQIAMNIHVLPYDDMHNKLQIALNSGSGAPDSVDIEISRFANFTDGDIQLLDMNEYVEPYKEDVLPARLGLYSKDGRVYGCPTHAGATVAFYNTELLEEVGIDYTTIRTWDDFKAAGSAYYEATGKSFGNLDTSSNMFFNLVVAELGADYVDESGKLSVNNEGIVAALELMKELQEANAVSIVPGGNPDCDEGYGAYASGEFAAMIMPLWMSSRFLNYMPDLEGKIVVAPAPVVEDTQALSVGGGGTGTAVVKTSEKAELAGEFIAYAKLSEQSNIYQWEASGNDPCNTAVWKDESVTENPDSVFLNFYANDPFETLNAVQDGFVLLDSQATKYYPSISNTFNTVVFNAVFESGDDIQETLDMAQEDLMNEFGY